MTMIQLATFDARLVSPLAAACRSFNDGIRQAGYKGYIAVHFSFNPHGYTRYLVVTRFYAHKPAYPVPFIFSTNQLSTKASK